MYLVLLGLVGVLNLVGLVMVMSASSIQSLQKYGSPWHYFERQVVWLGLGVVALVVARRVGHQRLRRLALPGIGVTGGLLCAVLIPGIGRSAAGASRWIGTASFQVQPSEFAKLALVLFAADILDRRSGRGDWKYQMMPVILVFAALGALVMLQPDMGTTMVLGAMTLAMLFTAGIPVRPLGGLIGTAGAGALLLAVAAPYRWRRMTSFWHPLSDASNTGYQAAQGLAAMGSGKLMGSGLGSSIASWGYLPNAQTDFIFAVIGEETGLIGTVALTGLFALLALVGTRIVCRTPDRYGALVGAGLTAWLVGQAVINIGAVVGLLPVTGVPLPFVSFGGSSLVIAMFGVGLLAHVARRS
ncbi:MAG: putative lipid II flippase FtsW [Acidimicrobiales bacterium]